jgi:hypothetical protein
MVRGFEPNPPELGEGFKPEHIAFHKKEWMEWSNCDDQAIGIIQLQLIDNLYEKVGSTWWKTSKNLEDTFGTPGLAIIHADFKKAISFRLTGGNPAPPLHPVYPSQGKQG